MENSNDCKDGEIIKLAKEIPIETKKILEGLDGANKQAECDECI